MTDHNIENRKLCLAILLCLLCITCNAHIDEVAPEGSSALAVYESKGNDIAQVAQIPAKHQSFQ